MHNFLLAVARKQGSPQISFSKQHTGGCKLRSRLSTALQALYLAAMLDLRKQNRPQPQRGAAAVYAGTDRIELRFCILSQGGSDTAHKSGCH